MWGELADLLVLPLLLLLLALVLYLLVRLHRDQQQLTELGSQLSSQLTRDTWGLFGQWQAYSSLRDRLDLHEGLPYTRDWSAAPDFLQLIVEHALEHQPRLILECSSGLTSLMLARCCQMNRKGDVISLENGAEYAAKTRLHLSRYGLEAYGKVIDAPLQSYSIEGEEYLWYQLDHMDDRSINMLVIDGPPGFIQRHSRFPALPLLYDKLADGCVVFMDDAAREDERQIVAMWQRAYPHIGINYLKTARGCSVLTINRADSVVAIR